MTKVKVTGRMAMETLVSIAKERNVDISGLTARSEIAKAINEVKEVVAPLAREMKMDIDPSLLQTLSGTACKVDEETKKQVEVKAPVVNPNAKVAEFIGKMNELLKNGPVYVTNTRHTVAVRIMEVNPAGYVLGYKAEDKTKTPNFKILAGSFINGAFKVVSAKEIVAVIDEINKRRSEYLKAKANKGVAPKRYLVDFNSKTGRSSVTDRKDNTTSEPEYSKGYNNAVAMTAFSYPEIAKQMMKEGTFASTLLGLLKK